MVILATCTYSVIACGGALSHGSLPDDPNGLQRWSTFSSHDRSNPTTLGSVAQDSSIFRVLFYNILCTMGFTTIERKVPWPVRITIKKLKPGNHQRIGRETEGKSMFISCKHAYVLRCSGLWQRLSGKVSFANDLRKGNIVKMVSHVRGSKRDRR